MEDVYNTYHDKEIVGVFHDKINRSLSLQICNVEPLILEKVIQIQLDYFSDQNIIFDIYKYRFNEIPNDVLEEYPFLNSYANSEIEYLYYHIFSSVGMTGIVICEVNSAFISDKSS